MTKSCNWEEVWVHKVQGDPIIPAEKESTKPVRISSDPPSSRLQMANRQPGKKSKSASTSASLRVSLHQPATSQSWKRSLNIKSWIFLRTAPPSSKPNRFPKQTSRTTSQSIQTSTSTERNIRIRFMNLPHRSHWPILPLNQFQEDKEASTHSLTKRTTHIMSSWFKRAMMAGLKSNRLWCTLGARSKSLSRLMPSIVLSSNTQKKEIPLLNENTPTMTFWKSLVRSTKRIRVEKWFYGRRMKSGTNGIKAHPAAQRKQTRLPQTEMPGTM